MRRNQTWAGIGLALVMMAKAIAQSTDAPPRPETRRTPVLNVATCQRPAYPPASIRAEESGTTRLRFTVKPDGEVESVEIARSSGFDRLDKAALDALRQCRFMPAHDENGNAVGGTTVVEYAWQLEDDTPNPWQNLSIDRSLYAERSNLHTLAFNGTSAATAALRHQVLSRIQDNAVRRGRCPSIESVAVGVPPKGVDIAPADDDRANPVMRAAQELWTLQQCGYLMRYVVTLQQRMNGKTTYHVAPFAPPAAR